jgi:hypothetical protein
LSFKKIIKGLYNRECRGCCVVVALVSVSGIVLAFSLTTFYMVINYHDKDTVLPQKFY